VKFKLCIASLLIALSVPLFSAASDEALKAAVESDARSAGNTQRDPDRRPYEALHFFGIQPDMAVAEIWPSQGWWSEILAPYLKDSGQYYAVGFSLTAKRTPGWRKNMARGLIKRFENEPDQFGNTIVTSLAIPGDAEIAPPDSLDMVLTFRNVHNWMNGNYAQFVFDSMFAALKPGGTLGLVEHRASDDADVEFMKLSGYVSEPHVISLAEAAGFVLIKKSEINANPKDNHNHPEGVWSLPPGLRYCGRIEDKEVAENCKTEYSAIGESDRMTIKFEKPVN
jgi:predicted methyltransferase